MTTQLLNKVMKAILDGAEQFNQEGGQTEMLGPRPDPQQIKFGPECFERVGTKIEFVVLRSALHDGPAVFDDESKALELAGRTRKTVQKRETPIMERIRWY